VFINKRNTTMNIQIANRHEIGHRSYQTVCRSRTGDPGREIMKFSVADVVLDHEGHTNIQYSAEINLKVRGTMLHAKETSEDIGKSVDLVVKSLEKQLKKHRDSHTASEAASGAIAVFF